jgi:hypothetical protein
MTFLESCRDIARRFVQTVVIVDDQAFTQEAETPHEEVIPPPLRGLVLTEPDADGKSAEGRMPVEDSQPAHDLDAGELSRQFASLGIVCAAYAPLQSDRSGKKTEADAKNTANLARHADIVVVDWLLDGQNPALAIGLIQRILDADLKEGGRLRLIAVYTGQDGLRHLRDQLLVSLQSAMHTLTSDDNGQSPAILGRHQRLFFLNKAVDGIEAGSSVVSLAELPGRLMDEFATMTRGIMPSVALASISAVRNGTHFLLAKFDATLDGTLAAPRAMLPDLEDAAAYASDLVAKKLSSVLEMVTDARSPASLENMEAWLEHEQKPGRFCLRDDQLDLSMDEVKALLRTGVTEERAKAIGISHNSIWKFQPHLYCGPALVSTANHAFARLACLKREAFGETYLPSDRTPHLTLGSPLFEEGNGDSGQFGKYHVCMQALCDSLRLEGPRYFPLLPLHQVQPEKKFSLAARLSGGRDV